MKHFRYASLSIVVASLSARLIDDSADRIIADDFERHVHVPAKARIACVEIATTLLERTKRIREARLEQLGRERRRRVRLRTRAGDS